MVSDNTKIGTGLLFLVSSCAVKVGCKGNKVAAAFSRGTPIVQFYIVIA
jgi:hypothetical protein